jgi:N-acetylglucosamine-6-phosphate deacetylase
MLLIKNATIVTATWQAERTAVRIAGQTIAAVGPYTSPSGPTPVTEIDAHGLLLVPGLIDLQLNGAFGHDFTADPSTIWPVFQKLPRFGVTSCLPTIITSPFETIERARLELLHNRPQDYRGAEPLGLHVEGPFLNPQKKGAHNPAYLRRPAPEPTLNWSPEQGVRLVTLAPELPGAAAVIAGLVERGVVVSAGHTMATYAEALDSFAAGVRYATHLFNAMTPLNHRAPGLPLAVLNQPAIVAGLIPDGIHVHPALIKLIWAMKGPQGLNLVSDAMAALGMPRGTYRLNDYEVTVSAEDCRLADGTLAGSVLPLDQALRNLMAMTSCSLAAALATCTTTPAHLLGIDQERGDIAPGMIADLLLLTPDLQIHTTIAAGQIAYQRQQETAS